MGKRDGAEDLVVWILRAMQDEVPGATTGALLRIEQRTRVHWGGAKPYIAKRPSMTRNGLLPGYTVTRWGLSRRGR